MYTSLATIKSPLVDPTPDSIDNHFNDFGTGSSCTDVLPPSIPKRQVTGEYHRAMSAPELSSLSQNTHECRWSSGPTGLSPTNVMNISRHESRSIQSCIKKAVAPYHTDNPSSSGIEFKVKKESLLESNENDNSDSNDQDLFRRLLLGQNSFDHRFDEQGWVACSRFSNASSESTSPLQPQRRRSFRSNVIKK